MTQICQRAGCDNQVTQPYVGYKEPLCPICTIKNLIGSSKEMSPDGDLSHLYEHLKEIEKELERAIEKENQIGMDST